MDWAPLALLLSIVVMTVAWWIIGWKPVGLPPGPRGLPFLGYYPFLTKTPHVTLTDLGRKYGGVFSLPFFTRYAIVLHDWKSIKTALVQQSSIFSGRPPNILSEVILKHTDFAFTNGIEWKERRRFTIQQLRQFGFGRRTMEGVIMEEVNQLLEHLQTHDRQKMAVNDVFFFALLNIIWTIVGGKRFAYGDECMREFTKAIDVVFQAVSNTNLVNLLPVFRHLPGSGFRQLLAAHKKTIAFLNEEIDEHVLTYQEGQPRDFIDAYLAEVDKRSVQLDPAGPRSFQKKHLRGVLWDLFMGGIDTSGISLTWALLYMINWPDVQRKVQQELDAVVGRERLPSYEDRIRLPYTEAVFLEIQRWATIVPLSIMHCTTGPTKLFDYTIPKSTSVIENIWAVHHDPDLWGDPEVFRPERFLDASGKVQNPEYLIPFSIGGRVCPGESLARMQMFLFFACVLHRFSFARVDGEEPPSLEPIGRLTLKPKPFSAMVRRR